MTEMMNVTDQKFKAARVNIIKGVKENCKSCI